jgi:phospholipid/cholesterol/gamma-HCH transport system substrate-binding protein
MTQRSGFGWHVATFAGFIALAIGFTLFWIGLGGGLPSLGNSYSVRALMPTAGSLTPGARVTMAGYQVGTITSIQRDGTGALVGMRLEDGRVTPIPADSRVALRERTPVGENYVTIFPGRSRSKLPSGAVLPMTQVNDYVDVDQVMSVLQGKTRDRTRQMVESLAGALAGRGDNLNAFLGNSADALSAGSRMFRVMADERVQMGNLVANLGSLSSAVGDRGAQIDSLAKTALTTFQAMSARDQAMRAFLDQLPSLLSQVRQTSATLNSVSQASTPVLYNLAGAVSTLRPAVKLLAPAAAEGRSVLDTAGAAAPGLQQALEALHGLGSPAAATLPQIHKTVCQLNPVIRYAKPYVPDIISGLGGLGSAANDYDAISHLIRVMLIVNDNTLVGLPAGVSQAAFLLLHSGLISKTTGPLSFDPYPKPGQIGKATAPASGGALGPSQVPATGYKFPHIVPDCR